jgi:hypothetical protein
MIEIRSVFMVFPPCTSSEYHRFKIGLYSHHVSPNKTKRERMRPHSPTRIEEYFMQEGLDLNRDGNRGMRIGEKALSIQWMGQGQCNTGSQHRQE